MIFNSKFDKIKEIIKSIDKRWIRKSTFSSGWRIISFDKRS